MSNSWSAGNVVNVAVQGYCLVKLENGKLLKIGGAPYGNKVCELFDPSTSLWTATGSLGTSRYTAAAVLLQDGTVLCAGGTPNGSTQLDTTEIYDPIAGTWSAGPTMGTSRNGVGLAVLTNGDVLAVGGQYIASAEILHAGSWSPTGSVATAMAYPSIAVLGDGRILAAGGDLNDTTVGDHAYTFFGSFWTAVDTGFIGLSTSFNGCNLTVDSNGLVYLIGGSGPPSGTISKICEVFNPNTNIWTQIADYPFEICPGWVSALENNQILVAGGQGIGTNAETASNIYNPLTDTWSSAPSLTAGRSYAVLSSSGPLPKTNDNRFIAASGVNNSFSVMTSVDIWTDTSSPTVSAKKRASTNLVF